MISRKDVQHIARLARIALRPEEEAQFRHELSAILDFVAKLGEADTSNVEPLAGGTELLNVTREDGGDHTAPRRADLASDAPRHRDGYVEVPAVFERE